MKLLVVQIFIITTTLKTNNTVGTNIVQFKKKQDNTLLTGSGPLATRSHLEVKL